MKHLRRWKAGGWVDPHLACRMQRTDQGQDLEIPIGHHISAPHDGIVTEWGHDSAFPNGFGDPYCIVWIDKGRFGKRLWYLGHGNADVPRVGHKFKQGERLCKLDNSLNDGWGWVEIGLWDGGPGPMGTGERFKRLFRSVWRWS